MSHATVKSIVITSLTFEFPSVREYRSLSPFSVSELAGLGRVRFINLWNFRRRGSTVRTGPALRRFSDTLIANSTSTGSAWRATFIVLTRACSGNVAIACFPSALTVSNPPVGPTIPYSTFGRETRAKYLGNSCVIILWTFSPSCSSVRSSGNRGIKDSSDKIGCSCHFIPSFELYRFIFYES